MQPDDAPGRRITFTIDEYVRDTATVMDRAFEVGRVTIVAADGCPVAEFSIPKSDLSLE